MTLSYTQPRRLRAPERFRGDFLVPGDPRYNAAAGIFNERVQGRPAAIARCANAADVRAALRLAREGDMEVSVRGGGHGIAGWASNDGGVVIDLTLLGAISVDPRGMRAWVGGGAQIGDLLVAAARHGLTAVTGAAPSVGIAGSTMGLGEGYLSPRHGFGSDHVLAFELVTADGALIRVAADEHPDLFWAMRGAGANFGVVTALELRLHRAPESALGGMLMFPGDAAEKLALHAWEIMERGSRHYWPQFVYAASPAGELGVMVVPGHTGSLELCERELAELRRVATPVADRTRRMSYVDLVFMHPDASGRRHWELARFPFGVDPERQRAALLEALGQGGDRGLAPGRGIALWRTIPPGAPQPPSAAPRLPGISAFLTSRWTDPAQDGAEVAWVERTAGRLFETGVVAEAANAANHVGRPDHARVRRLYGAASYERLERIKARYDPENVFRRNFNVPPRGTRP